MASKEPEDRGNNTAETEEDTIAARRKRLRRVSFADREITSVHIFNRDDDYETPPSASNPTCSVNAGAGKQENESPWFFRNLPDSDDSRDMLCSSPDEEHGHGGDLIVDGKLFLRPRSSPSSGGSTIGSATSNDDYKLFWLKKTDLVTATTRANMEERSAGTDNSMSHQSWINGSGKKNHSYAEKLRVDSRNLFAEGDISELVKVNVTLATARSNQLAHGMGPNEKEGPHKMDSRSSIMHVESSAIYATPLAKNYEGEYDLKAHIESASRDNTKDQQKLDSAKHDRQSSSIHQQLKPPLLGSISSSALRGQDLSLGTEDTSVSYVTPSPKQHGSFLRRKSLKLVESLSLIKKSKSRVKLISATSPASALMNRIQNSKLTLSRHLSSTATSADTGRQKNDNSPVEQAC